MGERRIGLAVGRTGSQVVLPAGHLNRSKLSQDIEDVVKAARERDVQGLVVGIPFGRDGAMVAQAKRTRRFVQALEKRVDLPVYQVDESFTTVEAEALLREAGAQPSRDRGSLDAAAAALILRRFLERES